MKKKSKAVCTDYNLKKV